MVWKIRRGMPVAPESPRDGFIELSELGEGPPRDAWLHWENLRSGRDMPRREDLDPVAIPKLLMHTIMVDVVDEPLDFIYTIVGQEFIETFGVNPRGQSVSAFAATRPPQARAFTDIYARVYHAKRPFAYGGAVGAHERSQVYRECVWLPLSVPDKGVDRIWCAMRFSLVEDIT